MSTEQPPEIFADELAGMMLGYPISKLTFAAARQGAPNGEIEKAQVLTLSIPTLSLLTSCKLILDNAAENQELIVGVASSSQEKLFAFLGETATQKSSVPEEKKKPKGRNVKSE